MKLIVKITSITLLALCFIQCSDKKSDKFIISKGKIGSLTKTTKISELKTIFADDSIVEHLSEGVKGDSYLSDDDKYLVYEKGGKHLMTLSPLHNLDSTSVVRDVEIFDARFKTEKGLTLDSKFEEISTYYNISSDIIESVGQSVNINIKELNIVLSYDKDKYTSGIQNYDSNISPEQIDAKARIKYFVMWFNNL